MNKVVLLLPLIFASTLGIQGCSSKTASILKADTLIQNGKVYLGDSSGEKNVDVAICGELICGVFEAGQQQISAKTIIDASGQIVSPGFIDPHTHSMDELLSNDKNHNLNYITHLIYELSYSSTSINSVQLFLCIFYFSLNNNKTEFQNRLDPTILI